MYRHSPRVHCRGNRRSRPTIRPEPRPLIFRYNTQRSMTSRGRRHEHDLSELPIQRTKTGAKFCNECGFPLTGRMAGPLPPRPRATTSLAAVASGAAAAPAAPRGGSLCADALDASASAQADAPPPPESRRRPRFPCRKAVRPRRPGDRRARRRAGGVPDDGRGARAEPLKPIRRRGQLRALWPARPRCARRTRRARALSTRRSVPVIGVAGVERGRGRQPVRLPAPSTTGLPPRTGPAGSTPSSRRRPRPTARFPFLASIPARLRTPGARPTSRASNAWWIPATRRPRPHGARATPWRWPRVEGRGSRRSQKEFRAPDPQREEARLVAPVDRRRHRDRAAGGRWPPPRRASRTRWRSGAGTGGARTWWASRRPTPPTNWSAKGFAVRVDAGEVRRRWRARCC